MPLQHIILPVGLFLFIGGWVWSWPAGLIATGIAMVVVWGAAVFLVG